MSECTDCELEVINCHDCEEFENYVMAINDLGKLKTIRRNLMLIKPSLEDTISGKIADWLVSVVGTMSCFYLFIVLATIPLVFPGLMSVVGYFSSGYLQLILLPLIMVAGNRADALREQKNEKEWKINLISNIIEEMIDNETLDKLNKHDVKSNGCENSIRPEEMLGVVSHES